MIFFRKQGSTFVVSGQTFSHKEAIKRLGGRFNGIDKVWHVPVNEVNETALLELCRKTGGGEIPMSSAPVTTNSPIENQTPHQVIKDSVTSTTEDEKHGLSISELMDVLQVNVNEAFPVPLWVVGEIQNISFKKTGVFLQLSEPKEADIESTISVKATIWAEAMGAIAGKIGKETCQELLQDGLKVLCLCKVGLYKDRGHITLAILDIDPKFTKGELALAREALLKELRKTGLDEANKKVPLTPFPFRVGLVSAEDSRAKGDFIDQLFSEVFPGEVLFVPTPMQGEDTPRLVSLAVRQLVREECDIIVITRGGGSAPDLRWFDTKEIAMAIACSPIPVISAIGHHEDVCIAEEISFHREKTPTAAAVYIHQVFEDTRERINDAAESMADLLSQKVEWITSLEATLREKIEGAGLRTVTQHSENLHGLRQNLQQMFTEVLLRLERRFTSLQGQIQLKTIEAISKKTSQTDLQEKRLVALDPIPWLKNGWTQLFNEKGKITSAKDLVIEDKVKARLLDALVLLEVKKIEKIMTQIKGR